MQESSFVRPAFGLFGFYSPSNFSDFCIKSLGAALEKDNPFEKAFWLELLGARINYVAQELNGRLDATITISSAGQNKSHIEYIIDKEATNFALKFFEEHQDEIRMPCGPQLPIILDYDRFKKSQ